MCTSLSLSLHIYIYIYIYICVYATCLYVYTYEPSDLFITDLITRSDLRLPLLKTRGFLRIRPRRLLILFYSPNKSPCSYKYIHISAIYKRFICVYIIAICKRYIIPASDCWIFLGALQGAPKYIRRLARRRCFGNIYIGAAGKWFNNLTDAIIGSSASSQNSGLTVACDLCNYPATTVSLALLTRLLRFPKEAHKNRYRRPTARLCRHWSHLVAQA